MKMKNNVTARNGRSSNNGSRPAKGKKRKPLFIALLVIGCAVVAYGAWMLFGNNYKSNAMSAKVNTIVASRLANIMLSDFQTNWVRVEVEKLAMNAKGEWVSTSDARQAVAWRQQFFKDNGAAAVLDKLWEDIQDEVGSMNLTPAKYRDTQQSFKALLEDMGQLVALTKNPGDSLLAMSTRLVELNNKIDSHLEASDFNFWVTFEDVKAKTDQLVPMISDKNVAEQLGKERDKRQNSAVNAMKYRKMGFQELKKGKGVLYREVEKGKGPKPKDDTKVRLHYEGKLMDGTVFDSSYQRGEPVTMRPSQTVPGFWHSLINMPVGSKWEIYIPYSEAYGSRAAGAVKPYSDLEFTIEVLGLEE